MKQKYLALLMVLLLCIFTFAACSSSDNNEGEITTVPTEEPAMTATPEPTETVTPEVTEAPIDTPEPTATEAPIETKEPTPTPEPTEIPVPTEPVYSPARELVDGITFGWNLGNTFDSFSGTAFGAGSLLTESSWGNPTTSAELFDLLKENGINAVRIPVTWYNHMDEEYTIDEKWMSRVKEVVDYAAERDFYIIINMHHDTGTEGWLKASDTDLEWKKQVFVRCWEQIAEEFKPYSKKLMFEGFNEILNDSNDWVNPGTRANQIVNELNQIFVDTVRASGGNNADRILICNTYCAGSGAGMLNGFVLPTDTVENSLVVEAHIYAPYQFTASEFPNVKTWSKVDIVSNISAINKKFNEAGIPVIIGEFGCVDKANEEERVNWSKFYMETANQFNIKCFWWDNGTEFALVNRRSMTVKQPNILGAIMAVVNGEEFVPNYEGNSESDNLCEDLGKWSGWIDVANGGSAVQEYLKNGISLTVESSGQEEWHVQGAYNGITLEQGVTYELELDYVATRDVPIGLLLQQGYGNYEVYHSDSLSATSEIQHFSGTFTMDRDTDNQVSIVFNCGKREAYVPFTVIFTNLSLKKVK